MHKLRISYIKVEDFLFHDDFHKSIIYHFFHNLTSILHFIKNKYFIFQRIQVYYLYKDLNNVDKLNLLNQMLKLIKFKNKKLYLKKNIVKKNKRKIENSSWLRKID